MAGFSDLLGAVITGTKDILVARENSAANARQYENAALQASVINAEKSRERELSLLQQLQQSNNKSVMGILSVLLGTVALSLLGVIFFNFVKRRG